MLPSTYFQPHPDLQNFSDFLQHFDANYNLPAIETLYDIIDSMHAVWNAYLCKKLVGLVKDNPYPALSFDFDLWTCEYTAGPHSITLVPVQRIMSPAVP